jgi:hypothetical protein
MRNILHMNESSGSHSDDYEDDVFWGLAPSSLIEIDRRFRDAYYLHDDGDRPDDGGSKDL